MTPAERRLLVAVAEATRAVMHESPWVAQRQYWEVSEALRAVLSEDTTAHTGDTR